MAVLRLNWGSRPKLAAVYAVDLRTGDTAARTEDGRIGCWPITELEAHDESGRYLPTLPAIQAAAGEVLGEE